METEKIYCGDSLQILKTFPDNCVDCCITSPPYWGLRDYQVEGQLGLEKTLEEYVAKMLSVFSEVKRVLKKEGVMFLNLGDSYNGASCGTSDKELAGYLNRDYLCENLCGECRTAYLIGKSRNDNSLVPKQSVSPSLPNHEHKEVVNDHSPTSDYSRQVNHNESSRQLQGECLREGSSLVCPLCERTSTPCVQECGYKTDCTFGIVQTDHPSNHDRLDISSLRKAYPDYTIMSRNVKLKPKDLVGIPWRVALALQADGWYLRQDIIWHKPNPMPESVTDRCTKAHEYIFLLTKNKKYYFDSNSIKIPTKGNEHDKWARIGRKRYPSKLINGIRNTGYYPMANKRSVWTVNTKPCKEAHFATFPEDLIRPCILAGCPKDGIVLDPFSGAGTTCLVSKKLGRNYVGIELNPDYVKMAENRIRSILF